MDEGRWPPWAGPAGSCRLSPGCAPWLQQEPLRPRLKRHQRAACLRGQGGGVLALLCVNLREELENSGKSCRWGSCGASGVAWKLESVLQNSSKTRKMPGLPAPLSLIATLTVIFDGLYNLFPSPGWKRWFPLDQMPAFHPARSFLP